MSKKITYLLWFAVIIVIISSCSHSKNSSQEKKQFTYSDLLKTFPELDLPYRFDEDSLNKSVSDSFRLSHEEVGRFFPDSIWFPDGESHGRAKIYPMGRKDYQGLRLLFIKSVLPDNKRMDLLVFGKKDTLLAAKEIASAGKSNPGEVFSFNLDKKFLLRVHERKQLPNGFIVTREQVYGINPDGSFLLIMTNTNEPASPNSYTNPIDTLPRRNRFSGDYAASKYNVVSIRDGGKKNTFEFFIHLNKGNGNCTGELDGTGKFISRDVGEYQEEGGPCAIRFTFKKESVTIREIGGCGAYRGINCFFEGSYRKKRK